MERAVVDSGYKRETTGDTSNWGCDGGEHISRSHGKHSSLLGWFSSPSPEDRVKMRGSARP